MVNVRSTNVDTILFIRAAERVHSGKYELVLQIENMEDRATVDIRIIGKVIRSREMCNLLILLYTINCPTK